jgi:hypothetical protein
MGGFWGCGMQESLRRTLTEEAVRADRSSIAVTDLEVWRAEIGQGTVPRGQCHLCVEREDGEHDCHS